MGLTVEERFWSKVDKRGPDECWPWTGYKGEFQITRKNNNRIRVRPCRFMWELSFGVLKDEDKLTVNCGNLKCINPNHLKIIEIGKADCHPNKPHFCRGMCKSCYTKNLYNTNDNFRKKSIEYATDSAYRHMGARLARRREHRKENRENYLDKKFRYEYNITYQDYVKMREDQGNVCAVCKKANRDNKDLVVDHDHINNFVRGLLCDLCNLGLGHFKDDISSLEEAVIYLKKKGYKRL